MTRALDRKTITLNFLQPLMFYKLLKLLGDLMRKKSKEAKAGGRGGEFGIRSKQHMERSRQL